MSVPRPTIAAWWQTSSTPRSAAATSAPSRTSPATNSAARVEVVRRGGVRGGMQPVEDPHVVAAREQRVDDVRADEAGAAGDEHVAHRADTVRISLPVELAGSGASLADRPRLTTASAP